MYGQAFYDTIRAGTQASAAVVVPLVDEALSGLGRVVDIGCGEGWWAAEFARLGWAVVGVDYDVPASSVIDVISHDMTESLPELGEFGLAVALEVAEHLPPARADSFVADLCRLAPVVLFSAAIPGQGGAGHLNEQWPAYWVERFADNGYAVSGALRWRIWNDPRVENWYRQNLLVAAADPAALPELFDTPLAEPWPVVHPVLFDARRG